MLKRILAAGALGGVVLMLWAFVANGIFGFTSRMRMGRIPDERAVYLVLKEHIREPGLYIANPEPVPDVGFPEGEPVFAVHYAGMGHEAAGRLLFVEPAWAFLSTLLAAALLSMTSERVLSRYARRVLFLVLVGFLLALWGNLTRYGIGGYPLGAALLLAANDLAAWAAAGLAMAWPMRTRAGTEAAA